MASSKKSALTIPAEPISQDAQMGAQLTAQYHRAVGGMREVLIFGAMMMQLREAHPELAQKGPASKSKSTRGLTTTDQPVTLQKWLETHAPEVKRTTALRFLAVTESIAESYDQIVGAKVAKKFSLPALVTAAPDQLDDKTAAKQLELFEFVNGTSQRSWLDRFVPDKEGGGNNYKRGNGKGKGRVKTPEELAKQAKEEIEELLSNLDSWFSAAHHTRVDGDVLATAEALLEDALKRVRAVNRE